MELRSLSLQKLNRLAERRRFCLEDLQFAEIQQQQFWAPPEMSPFFYLPSFQRLTLEQRRRYNQLFALGVAEQFIWFEGHLLATILPKISQRTQDQELKLALQYFLQDEEKHTEMFWHLLQRQEPKLYPQRRFQFLNLGFFQREALRLMTSFPQWNLAWIWMAIFFEERTLSYSHQYIQASGIDRNFVQAHSLHLQDEVRHFQMDLYFLEEYYQHQPWWKKIWARFMMGKMLKAYISPRRVSHQILNQMQEEFVDLSQEVTDQIKSELAQISHNKKFVEMAFGNGAVPRSRELMARYPEMKNLLKIIS